MLRKTLLGYRLVLGIGYDGGYWLRLECGLGFYVILIQWMVLGIILFIISFHSQFGNNCKNSYQSEPRLISLLIKGLEQ